MSPRRTAVSLAFLLFSLLSCLLLPAGPAGAPQALAGERGPQQFGEARPDKALVYLIRTSRMSGAARTQFVYADEAFLGVLRSGSYGFAYVDPGKHPLWTNWTKVTKEAELVAGQTYYFDVWMSIATLDEARGRALIDEVRDFMTPGEDDKDTAAKQIADRYERAKRKESEKDKAEVETVAPAVVPPEYREGMSNVPANTAITLELLENVCSRMTTTGETIWFRVAADAAVEGGVFLKKGTMVKGTARQVEPAKGGGQEGTLDIAVPAITAIDGNTLATVGLILSSGQERHNTADANSMAFGAIGFLAVRGRQAYHFAGEEFKVFTRGETWVRAAERPAEGTARAGEAAGGAGAADERSAPPVAPSRAISGETSPGGESVLQGQAPDPIEFRPKKGKVTQTVTIEVASESQPRDLMIVALGGWVIPEPVRPTSVARHGKGWRCTFDGWQIARYLREGYGSSAVPVEMRGTLQNGRPFLAEAAVVYTVDHD